MPLAQAIQPRFERDLIISVTTTPSKDLRVSIERFDGLFFDKVDSTFKTSNLITDLYVPIIETPPASGDYQLTISVTAWNDGNYKTDLYDHTISPTSPTKLEDNATVYVDGGSGAPMSTTKTKVNHHYGGADALRYTETNGNPVENADVYAFLTATFDINAASIQAIAKTTTNTEGRWNSPFFLEPGQYTILFIKTDFFGPNTTNIVVI